MVHVPYDELIADADVSLANAKVIPDVVDDVAGSASLTVKYGDVVVKSGMSLTPSQAAEAPTIEVKGPASSYTLVMVDPDAPSPAHPKFRNFLHWILASIPPHDVKQGEELEEYMGPEPPQGKHRYVFLLYEQHAAVTKPPAGRKNFQVKQWAKDHGLSEKPAAAVFFFSEAE